MPKLRRGDTGMKSLGYTHLQVMKELVVNKRRSLESMNTQEESFSTPRYDKDLEEYRKANKTLIEKVEFNGLETSVKTEVVKPKRSEELLVLDRCLEVLEYAISLLDQNQVELITKKDVTN